MYTNAPRREAPAGDRRPARTSPKPHFAAGAVLNYEQSSLDQRTPPRAALRRRVTDFTRRTPHHAAKPMTSSSPSTMTQSTPVSPRPRPGRASVRSTPSRVTRFRPVAHHARATYEKRRAKRHRDAWAVRVRASRGSKRRRRSMGRIPAASSRWRPRGRGTNRNVTQTEMVSRPQRSGAWISATATVAVLSVPLGSARGGDARDVGVASPSRVRPLRRTRRRDGCLRRLFQRRRRVRCPAPGAALRPRAAS